jgi:hypothetical protein
MSKLKMQNDVTLSERAIFLFVHRSAKTKFYLPSAQIKNAGFAAGTFCAYRDPAGIRTQDPYIKSVMLYQLSYGIVQPSS